MRTQTLQPLLAHFDAQEAAMLALKSLLFDIGLDSESDNSRDLMRRITAATDLLRKLDHDCQLLIQQLAKQMNEPPSDLSIRYLIACCEQTAPETADALRSCRSRLLSLRWQLERLAASSGWVLSERRRIRHTIFQHASGISDSNRYDASGRTALSPDSLRFGTRS